MPLSFPIDNHVIKEKIITRVYGTDTTLCSETGHRSRDRMKISNAIISDLENEGAQLVGELLKAYRK
jgi:hypothetical protein